MKKPHRLLLAAGALILGLALDAGIDYALERAQGAICDVPGTPPCSCCRAWGRSSSCPG